MVKNLGLVLLGNTIYAGAVTMFILPNSLITGGTTGLALVLSRLGGFSVVASIAVLNVFLFVMGAAFLGRNFAWATIVSTIYYPFILDLFQRITSWQHLTSDHLLAAIYAGVMIGLSIGLVIKAGASTGGMDIPPLILNKKFGLSISGCLYGFDLAILLSQMLFADREQVLYGILLVFIYTVVLDRVLLQGHSSTQVQVISNKYQEINQAINTRLDRGSTLIQAETGYLRHQSPVLLTVVSNRELTRLNEVILSIDPQAFIIINRVNEVKGRGFTLGKMYQP